MAPNGSRRVYPGKTGVQRHRAFPCRGPDGAPAPVDLRPHRSASDADELEAFSRDAAPDAVDRVLDRCLRRPLRRALGRHWLDVARYADTKDGVLMYGDDRIRPYAYTYREYVIRAFNEDLPYDRFIHEQLAADQIEPRWNPGDWRPWAS